MADNNIDIEQIMESIRADIKASGADKKPLSFVENVTPVVAANPDDRLSQSLAYISCNYEVQPYQLLTGNPIKVFIKKCLRKMSSFYFLPIVAQQNTFNYHVYQVCEAVKAQREEVEILKAKVTELEAALDEIRGTK